MKKSDKFYYITTKLANAKFYLMDAHAEKIPAGMKKKLNTLIMKLESLQHQLIEL